jgi:hypothetical protein
MTNPTLRRRLLPAFLLCLTLGLAACDMSTPLEDPSIQPLAVGNRWVFADSIYGVVLQTGTTEISIPGLQSVMINGGERGTYRWQVSTDGEVQRTNFVAMETTSFYHYGIAVGGDTLHLRTQWARYPTAVGHTFVDQRYAHDPATGQFTLTEAWTWETVAVDRPVPVGSGRMQAAVVYRTRPDTATEHLLYYVPGIGYAGWRTFVNGQVVFSQTLVSYHLNQPQ